MSSNHMAGFFDGANGSSSVSGAAAAGRFIPARFLAAAFTISMCF
jgi:hypothetical protein